MSRRITVSVITSLFQTIVYYVVFYVAGVIGTLIRDPAQMTISEAVGFSAFFKFSIIAFGVIITVMNLIDALVNQKRWTWILVVLVTVFYVIYWGQDIRYIPFKTGLFLLAGVVAIYAKFPGEKLLLRLIGTSTSANT